MAEAPESRVLIVITGMRHLILLPVKMQILMVFLGGTICMQHSEDGLVPV